MATFAGTQQKCMACEKTIYLVDKLVADNRVFQKACFRCHHCNSGKLLLFGRGPILQASVRPTLQDNWKLGQELWGTPKVAKPERQIDIESTIKVSNKFVATKDKCLGCSKTVYPTEKVTVNGTAYHRGCFKCCHGRCTISPSNYILFEGKLRCKHHHIQLFKEKGNYSQLESENERSTSSPIPVEIAAES